MSKGFLVICLSHGGLPTRYADIEAAEAAAISLSDANSYSLWGVKDVETDSMIDLAYCGVLYSS